jgi:hypothetical protein
MGRRQTLGRLTIWAALALGCAAAAQASPPWGGLFSRVEADADKTYPLTEHNGPWMIMACSFTGEGAEQQAQDLASELRSRYKFEAYAYKVRIDLHDVQGRGVDRFGSPVKMRCRVGTEIQEIAVLVGNYQTVDDPEAQSTLQKIRYAQPKCLEVGEEKKTNQSLAGLRLAQQQLQATIHPDKRKKGPMDHAFVTTNPLLPKEYFVPNGVDPLVLGINKEVPHSLLDCPGSYTVQVAHFRGAVIVNQKWIRDILEKDTPVSNALAQAAQRAHALTEALRLKGYEAYEFHDRYASIVTVGSFDSESDPKINLIVKTFGAAPTTQPGQPPGPVQPKKMGPFEDLGEIYFDIQPLPVHVPKRSVAAAYSRSSLGAR